MLEGSILLNCYVNEERGQMIFVYLMNNQKPLNEEIISSHVEYLRGLETQGELILCGPFTDYPGGMVIV